MQNKFNSAVETLFEYAYERENSIAKTRERNRFYTETKLDTEKLSEAILNKKHDLVILQGTPGCGKSEFIHALVKQIEERGLSGEFAIKHDATHVEEKRASAVNELKRYLSAFNNEALSEQEKIAKLKTLAGKDLLRLKDVLEKKKRQDGPVYVVGVNRGIMHRVFADPNFSELRTQCNKGYSDNSRIVFIDLSARSYVAPCDDENNSLCSKLISKVTAVEQWEDSACNSCDVAEHCPFLINAKYLRNNAASNPLSYHLELLHLKKQCILTFRDLLGILSYVIVGNKSYYRGYETACDAIREWVKSECWQRLALLLVWNTSVADVNLFESFNKEVQGNNYRKNRTCGRGPKRFFDSREGVLAQFDPLLSKSQFLDDFARITYADPRETISAAQHNFTRLEQRLFAQIFENLDRVIQDISQIKTDKVEQENAVSLSLTNYLKRRHYFSEFKTLDFEDKTEYQSIELFKKFLLGDTATIREVKEIIKKGIIMSDRLEYDSNAPKLKVTDRLKLSDAYLELQYDKMKIDVAIEKSVGTTDRFVETALSKNMSVKIRFCDFDISPIIFNLDMFEVLYRIQNNWDPSFVGDYSSAFLTAIKSTLMKNIAYYEDLRVVVKANDRNEQMVLEYDPNVGKFCLKL